MTDNRIVKATARDPEREALGSVRGGLRAMAKKAAKKVAKKAGRKKVAKKATTTSGKTTAASKTADSDKTAATDRAAAVDKTAPAGKRAAGKTVARAPASEKKAARVARATADAPASGSASAEASEGAAKSRPPKTEEGSTVASEGIAAASPALSRESEPSMDSPRPPGPVHPGAIRDSIQEQSDGMGGLLALWGPLIIVGFLVLVFRGGDEPEMAVVAGTDDLGAVSAETEVAPGADAPDVAMLDATVGTMPAAVSSGARPETPSVAPSETSFGARPENLSVALPESPPGASPENMETLDRGFAVRTSMAGPPVLPGRGASPGAPAVAPRAFYPPPSGPYRDPRYRGLPTGERWSSGGSGDWMWSATKGRAGAQPAPGGDPPVRWVRCEAPYYWCPAPNNPAW